MKQITLGRIVIWCVLAGLSPVCAVAADAEAHVSGTWAGSFDIHFPAEMERWTRLVASQMESVATAVNEVVGNAPESRVTVIVEDPSNIANGFALPFLALKQRSTVPECRTYTPRGGSPSWNKVSPARNRISVSRSARVVSMIDRLTRSTMDPRSEGSGDGCYIAP